MSYSVGVQNIFELLDDENDDQPNVKTPKTKLDDDKVSRPATKGTQAVVGDRAPVKGAHRDQNRREGGNQRSPKPRGDRPPRAEGDRPPREGGDRPRAPRTDGDRPPRRPRPEGAAGGSSQNQNLPEGGERRPRGPRPQGGKVGEDRDKERWQKETRENRSGSGEGSGKRVYDRRSGTGRGPKENKKSGAGGANWGNEKDPNIELQAEQEVKEDAKAEQTEEGAPAASGEVAAEAVAVEEKPKEEEPEGVSLEEFKRQRESKLAALPTLPPPRRAGEGVTDKEKDAWAQVSLTQETSSTPAAKETRGVAAKKETVSLDKLFHIKSKEERDRAERRDRPERSDRDRPERSDRDRPDRRDRGDRPDREDRKPRTERTDKRPADRKPRDAPAKPQSSKPKADIVNNDQEFPTLATKA